MNAMFCVWPETLQCGDRCLTCGCPLLFDCDRQPQRRCGWTPEQESRYQLSLVRPAPQTIEYAQTQPQPTHQGLGDKIEAGLAAIGITEESWMAFKGEFGEPCGCAARKQWLNDFGERFGAAARKAIDLLH